jgi:hypothetical protein
VHPVGPNILIYYDARSINLQFVMGDGVSLSVLNMMCHYGVNRAVCYVMLSSPRPSSEQRSRSLVMKSCKDSSGVLKEMCLLCFSLEAFD